MKLSKRHTKLLAGIGVLLSLPLIAMQFTTEVNWTFLDFAVAGIMLSGSGLLCDLIISRTGSRQNRTFAGILLLVVFLFILAELAVGIIGSPLAGS